MTIKLIAIYRKPTDTAAFDDHYAMVHTPLVEKIPGLQSLTVNRVDKHLFGPDEPYMVVEMVYPDRETFERAMASDENKATGKDVMGFANGIVSLVVTSS
jgi:uncharacterized protein (TIGR02118 family)